MLIIPVRSRKKMSQNLQNPISRSSLDTELKSRQILTKPQLDQILEGRISNFEVLFSYPEENPTHYQLLDTQHDVGIIVSVRPNEVAVVEATYNRHRIKNLEELDKFYRCSIEQGLCDHQEVDYRK